MSLETIKTKHDIFLSYRRDGGLELAEKLYDALRDKFMPFFDKNSMRGGTFDTQIYEAIQNCDDFIIILSPGALDERTSENDWVRIEIKTALDNKKNIIPITFEGFIFPASLPKEIQAITRSQIVPYSGDYSKCVDEVKDFLLRYKDGRVLAEYAEFLQNKYSKIKLITREIEHDKLFVNLHLMYIDEIRIIEKNKIIIEEQNIICASIDILNTTEPNVIIGNAGAGKSSVVRDLLLACVKKPEDIAYVPVFIEMSSFCDNMAAGHSPVSYISEITGFNDYELRYISKSGKIFLLIFDGMDEVPNSSLLDNAIESIENFLQNFPNVKVIFTSRPSSPKIQKNNNFRINGKEVKKYYIEQMTNEERNNQIHRIIAVGFPKLDENKFLSDLSQYESRNPFVKELTTNPLLLSLIISVYQDDSFDGGRQGAFPKNKIELYERAVSIVIKDRKETHIDYLPEELKPLTEVLLGEIAYSLYENLQNKNDSTETIKVSENIIRQGIQSFIAYKLKTSQENAKHLTEKFVLYLKERAIFNDNKFLHETFKEYFAALFIYSNLFAINDTPFGRKIKPVDEDVLSEKISFFNSNENTHAVIEMLLCYIDRETLKDETAISVTIEKILSTSLTVTPSYDLLCAAVEQFINHRLLCAVKLITSMFERGCEKAANPYSELFWYMSEYDLLAGISNKTKDPVNDKKTSALDTAYEAITKKYNSKEQELLLAGICYNLYRYLYIDIDSAWDEYVTLKEQLKPENKDVSNKWWNDKNNAFIWITDKNKTSFGKGNLLYLNSTAESVGGGMKNTRFIKISTNNQTLFTDDYAVYSKDKSVLYHCVRKTGFSLDYTILNNCTKIVDKAFSDCIDLTKVTLPDSVVSIGDDTFRGCVNLENILLSDLLGFIGVKAFAGCRKCYFTIKNNLNFQTDGKILYNAGKTELLSYPSASGKVVIPESVDKITPYAFANCPEITSIKFLNSIFIPYMEFFECGQLEEIIFANGVNLIKSNCDYFPVPDLNFEMPQCDASFDDCVSYSFVLIFNNETNLYNLYYPDLTLYAEGDTIKNVIGVSLELIKYYFDLATKYETEVPRPSSAKALKEKWTGYEINTTPFKDHKTPAYFSPFFNCKNLKRVIISETVTNISKGIFLCQSENIELVCSQNSYAEQYGHNEDMTICHTDEDIESCKIL